jgi:hypothetical protein
LVAPAAAVNLYVAPTANDTGNNCQVQANPCTVAHALAQIPFRASVAYDLFFADGHYFGEISLPFWSIVNLTGNCGNLSAVRLFPSASGRAVVTAQDGAILGLSCMRIEASSTSGNVGILSRQHAIVDFQCFLCVKGPI